MNNIYHIIVALVFSFALSSCDEDSFSQVVDIPVPEHEPKLAFSVELTQADSLMNIFVSNSTGINDDGVAPKLNDASIKLFKNNNQIGDFIFDEVLEEYSSKIPIIQNDGALYRIEIENPEFGKAQAEQAMPIPVAFENLLYEEDGAIDFNGNRVDEISLTILDPGNESNYYAFDFFSFIIYENSTELNIQQLYLDTADPLTEFGEDGTIILSDATFDGNKYTARFNISEYQINTYGVKEFVILARLKSLSKDNYLFERSLSQYWNARDNPFAEPVVVHNNIENGYGIFRTSSFYEDEIKIK